jgi:hypothetical protein
MDVSQSPQATVYTGQMSAAHDIGKGSQQPLKFPVSNSGVRRENKDTVGAAGDVWAAPEEAA